jgi:hypothetical protein
MGSLVAFSMNVFVIFDGSPFCFKIIHKALERFLNKVL